MAGKDPAKTSIDQILGDFGAQLLIGGILSSRQWDELRQKVDSGKWPSTARELASRMVYERLADGISGQADVGR